MVAGVARGRLILGLLAGLADGDRTRVLGIAFLLLGGVAHALKNQVEDEQTTHPADTTALTGSATVSSGSAGYTRKGEVWRRKEEREGIRGRELTNLQAEKGDQEVHSQHG